MKGNCAECSRRWACDIDPNECDEFPDLLPLTNADHIRDWNDHELAETIADFVSEIDNGDVRYSDDPNDWLKWLQQSAEQIVIKSYEIVVDKTVDCLHNYCPHCGAKMMPQPPKGE